MNLYVGTSGYSYKEWKGTFYPEDLPDKQMLRFYGERFRVGRNQQHVLSHAQGVRSGSVGCGSPARFQVRAQGVAADHTHQRLKDAGDSVAYLLKVAGALKERLGPLLFQLPPYLKKDLAAVARFSYVAAADSAARPSSSAISRGSTTKSSAPARTIRRRCASPKRKTNLRFRSYRRAIGVICDCEALDRRAPCTTVLRRRPGASGGTPSAAPRPPARSPAWCKTRRIACKLGSTVPREAGAAFSHPVVWCPDRPIPAWSSLDATPHSRASHQGGPCRAVAWMSVEHPSSMTRCAPPRGGASQPNRDMNLSASTTTRVISSNT